MRLEPTVITPLTAIADAVRGTMDADAVEATQRRLRLLDTVDRRLAKRGLRLESEAEAEEPREKWLRRPPRTSTVRYPERLSTLKRPCPLLN